MSPARTLGGVALLMLSAAALHGQTHVQENVEVRYYDVSGTTAAELDAELDDLGPGSGDARWAGYTSTRLGWSYTTVPDAEGCAVTDPHTRLEAHVTLPRWQPAPDAAPGLRRAWRDFADALEAHERGHVQLGRDAAHALHDTLSAVRAPTCEAAEHQANAAGHRAIGRLAEAHARYDRETGHGLAQGAVRPSVALRGGAAPGEPAGGLGNAPLVALALVVLLMMIARPRGG